MQRASTRRPSLPGRPAAVAARARIRPTEVRQAPARQGDVVLVRTSLSWPLLTSPGVWSEPGSDWRH